MEGLGISKIGAVAGAEKVIPPKAKPIPGAQKRHLRPPKDHLPRFPHTTSCSHISLLSCASELAGAYCGTYGVRPPHRHLTSHLSFKPIFETFRAPSPPSDLESPSMTSPAGPSPRELESGLGAGPSDQIRPNSLKDSSNTTGTTIVPSLNAPTKARPENAQGDPHIPASSLLRQYQDLIGITEPDIISTTANRPYSAKHWYQPKKRINNTGLYRSIVDQKAKAAVGYYFSSTVINSSLGIQIVIAATITALAAFGTYRIPVVVLGALNTVLAAILTYMKGQGLPTRCLQYRNDLRRVKEYADAKEREFALGLGPNLLPLTEFESLRKLFEDARKNFEDNYPDTYVNTSGNNQLSPKTPDPKKPIHPDDVDDIIKQAKE